MQSSSTIQVKVIIPHYVDKAVAYFLSVVNGITVIPSIKIELNDATQIAQVLIFDIEESEINGTPIYKFWTETSYQALCETYNYQCLGNGMYVPQEWYELIEFNDEF